MSQLKICRICLNSKVKMHEFDKYKLKEHYEQIMSMTVKENDGLPRYFCYECATLIHKFYKFKKKCVQGQKELKRLMGKGRITLQKVMQLDRKAKKLSTSLNVSTVTKRVKTYIEKHHHEMIPRKRKPRTRPPIPIVDPEKMDIEVVDTKPIKTDEDSVTVKTESFAPQKEESMDNMDDRDNSSDEDYKEEKPVVLAKVKKRTKVHQKKKSQVKIQIKKRELNEENWQMLQLTEEVAAAEFQARAHDSKYIRALYKCTSCFKGFSKEDMIKRHNKLRHSESIGSIECRFCHIRFKVKSFLDRHIREHYIKYKCLRCELTFTRETSAQNHDEFHNGVTRTCEYCNETFKHLSTYYTHLRKHRSQHVCPVCGESFVSEFGLKLHKSVKHIIDNDKQEVTIEETTYCEKCDIKFETTKAYEEHLTHSAMHLVSEESNQPMNLKMGSVVRRRVTRRQTTCSFCNKVFSTVVAYTKHHKMAHPDFPMPVFRAKYYTKGQGKKNGQERVICDICGALLAANSMYSHLNTHTRKKQYTCTTCGMQFNAKGTLQRHYLTHTGEKPIECTLCDKRFTQAASMKLHYNTIHLKQPYPVRNRNKKSEDSDESAVIAQYYQNKDSDESPLERWRTFRL